MTPNSLKSKVPVRERAATLQRPRPADFPLGSIESRAAARAIVQELTEANDRPRDGDVVLDLSGASETRAHEIYTIIHEKRKASNCEQDPIPRIPGIPKFWLKFPDGFNPDRFLK